VRSRGDAELPLAEERLMVVRNGAMEVRRRILISGRREEFEILD